MTKPAAAKRLSGLISILALMLAIAGCGGASPAASTVPSVPAAGVASGKPGAIASAASASAKPAASITASGKPLTKIVEALPTRDFGYLPSIVANAKGYYRDAGLEVELPIMTSQVAIPALTTKQIQFGAHGSAERAAYQGAPLRGIWYAWQVNTFYAVGGKDVKSYKDLKGKVIAIASPGSSEDVVVHLLLKREGISPSEVSIIPLGGGPPRAQAMLSGQVQFSVLNPDVAVQLEQQGMNLLGSMSDVLPVPWAGFAVHQDLIREQPDMLKGWLRAHILALQFIKANPKETAAIAVKELQTPESVAEKAVQLMLPAISDDDPGGLTEQGLILNTQVDMDAIKMTGDPLELGKKVNDLNLLRQVQRDMGIKCTKGFQC